MRLVGVFLMALVTLGLDRPVPVTGTVEGEALDYLTATWDSTDAMQLERAYCVTEWRRDASGYVISKITEPDSSWDALPWQVNFHCAPTLLGTRMPELHTHPPSQCNATTGTCRLLTGGAELDYHCKSSLPDLLRQVFFNLPFSAVQCDRTRFAFYR